MTEPHPQDTGAIPEQSTTSGAVDTRQQIKDLIDKHTYAVLQEGKSGITRETLADEHLALISQAVSSAETAARIEGMKMVDDALMGGYIPGVTPPEAITVEFIRTLIRMLIWENDDKPATAQRLLGSDV